MKYKVVCKECNKTFSVHEKGEAIVMPSKCPDCGSSKMGTVEDISIDVKEMVFDISICNKKTGMIKRTSFVISKSLLEKQGKDLNKMREAVATEMAKSIHQIVSSNKLLSDLLEGK